MPDLLNNFSGVLVNILKVLEDKHLEPKVIFRDVFELNKKDFQRIYKLDWWLIAKHCLIFLKILKDNSEDDYNQFFIMWKGVRNKKSEHLFRLMAFNFNDFVAIIRNAT